MESSMKKAALVAKPLAAVALTLLGIPATVVMTPVAWLIFRTQFAVVSRR